MLTMAIPWWEFLLRGVVVYVFLIVLLRVTGKRQVGQLAPFDLVLLLVLILFLTFFDCTPDSTFRLSFDKKFSLMYANSTNRISFRSLNIILFQDHFLSVF